MKVCEGSIYLILLIFLYPMFYIKTTIIFSVRRPLIFSYLLLRVVYVLASLEMLKNSAILTNPVSVTHYVKSRQTCL